MQTTITKTDHVIERKVRDNVILVPMKTGPARLDALYTLNEAASLLWKEIDGETTKDKLVIRLLAEYEVDDTTARKDVDRILNELASIGAITLTP
jgi:hypothetical protein